MTYFIEKDEVKEYFDNQINELEEKGYTSVQITGILSLHYTKDMVVKYSCAEQDRMMDEWFHLILEVKGGYWQVQELIQQPHSEFTHYDMCGSKSYEKGNVSRQMAKRELSADSFKSYCKKLDKIERLINETEQV